MSLAPVALFVYNRPHHARKVLSHLKLNELAADSTLYIFCDGPRAGATPEELAGIRSVRELAASEQWCGRVEIIQQEHNAGLAASIVNGVTRVVNESGSIIVLEDDLVPSPGFLQYMNDALRCYAAEEKVMHISAYNYPRIRLPFSSPGETFFMKFMACWGWGTWQRAWKHYQPSASGLKEQLEASGAMKKLDLDGATTSMSGQLIHNADGSLSSWAIKWYASILLKDGLCLYPENSLIRNTGNDGTGTHPDRTDIYSHQVVTRNIVVRPMPLTESRKGRNQLRYFFRFLEKKKINTG